MKTLISWRKTSEELPERELVFEGVKNKIYVDKPVLVVWEGKIKPSRYISEQSRWEGHTKDQIPEYWTYVDEMEFVNEGK